MKLPTDFVTNMRSVLGTEYADFEVSLGAEQPVSVRLNVAKCHRLGPLSIPTESVAWCASGRYLHVRPAFTFDPLFHAGCYYVQEASSMFVEQVVRQYVKTPSVVLDLCAAPGGKSTLLCSCLPEGSILVANEVARQRAQVLAENLTKWGQPAVIVTNDTPKAFGRMEGCFDVILTDVPCSGEGMFRKDETAVGEWSRDNVQMCAARQRDIVAAVWPALKEGGLLVYSTCTFNQEENEHNVEWIVRTMGAELLPMEVDPNWGIGGDTMGGDMPVCHFFPHRTRGEGFFLAVLRKTSEATVRNFKTRPNRTQGVGALLRNVEEYVFGLHDNVVSACPLWMEHFADVVRQCARTLQAGIEVAEQKGHDLVPRQALAMSVAFDVEAYPHVNLDYLSALAYLRKEAVTIDAPRGIVLVCYKDVPLGFVKNLGNRANNLYPPEWRIRSGYNKEHIDLWEKEN
ncbi:MAG: rRNA cytosine-C5-methyltransferase [Bacteroidales bacterium]|nr:rRNA cytosine-C5-methyltransferase [Bacteroidales bacterium]